VPQAIAPKTPRAQDLHGCTKVFGGEERRKLRALDHGDARPEGTVSGHVQRSTATAATNERGEERRIDGVLGV